MRVLSSAGGVPLRWRFGQHAAALYSCRSQLAVLTAERQPEIDALSRRPARQKVHDRRFPEGRGETARVPPEAMFRALLPYLFALICALAVLGAVALTT